MKAKIFLPGVILLLLSNWFVLRAEKTPIKWGKLLPEDIKMTIYSPDPEAPAVVLCDYGTTAIGPRTQYTRHIRMKILKEAGLAYAKVEIPYRSCDKYDYFMELKAQTFNVLPNGTLVKTKMKSSKIEDIQTDRRHGKKVFTFPDVKVGSIIEYTYTINSLDIVKLNNWYFQSSIPVLWSEYRVYVPRRFDYLLTFQQGRQLDMNEQKDYADRLQWLYSTRINKVYGEIAGNKDILYESPKKSIKVYLMRGESMRFVMNNMPAIKGNATISSVTDLYPYVKVHLYQAEGGFPFYYRPSLSAANDDYDVWNRWESKYNWRPGFVLYWLPTWEEATQKWLKNEYLGMRLVKNFNSKPVMDAVSHIDSINLLKGIYQYIKDNVKWDGTYSMYANRDFNDVLKKKTGSSGEINLLLINLFRKSGFTANPVLIRTRELGRVENLYPEKGQFNHVIAQVEKDGKVIYLDATSDGIELPHNVENTVGWLLKEQGYAWVTVENALQGIVRPAVYKQI